MRVGLRRILLMLVASSLGISADAAAEAFDLDCVQAHDDGHPDPYSATTHYQIDMDAGHWCDGACESVREIVATKDDDLVLEDELRNDHLYRRVYSRSSGMLKRQVYSGREVTFSCQTQAFRQLRPYLAREARPKTPTYKAIGRDDFLRDEGGERVEGTVGIELQIDAAGRPTECSITASSGDSRLDQHTCRLLLDRLTFLPAMDENGEAVPGRFRNRVQWRS